MRRIIGGAVLAMSLVFAGSAGASGLAGETITTTLAFPAFPTRPPNVGQYFGTFSASGPVSDSGTVSADALFGAVPSPSAATLHTTRTLTGAQGTLVLRCQQIVKDFSDLSAAPDRGTCTILSATGAYAGAHGSGKVTGVTDFLASPVTVTDVLTL
jgi:hypothetical protein